MRKKLHKKGDIVRILHRKGATYQISKGNYLGICEKGFHKVSIATGEIVLNESINIYTRRNTAILGLVRYINSVLGKLTVEIYVKKKSKKTCKGKKNR